MASSARQTRTRKATHGRALNDTKPGGGTSLDRLLGLLGLFTAKTPIVSAEDMISALKLSRSSGYRYLKALAEAGLIAAVANGHYVLGPRVIQLDLQIRQ